MASFYNAQGEVHQLPIELSMYQAASDKGMSLAQYLNHTYPTNPEKYGSTFDQVLASEGIFLKGDKEFGIRPSTLQSIMNPQAGGVVTKDSVPTTRIVFPAAILQAVEDKLVANLTITADAFDKMVAVDDAISNDRFIRPVLNFSKPEAARSQGIAQLATPASMLSITVSEVARTIPTYSLGMEVSDQALKNVTLDLTALALARQAATERNARTQQYILQLLNGDTDMGTSALSSISGKVQKASSYDASITTAGALTQKAWMSYLFNNATRRTITHVVTDLAGALAIENRTGKPVITQDNPQSPRIDTLQSVVNPMWPSNVKVFISLDPNWPANTIMGFDVNYGIHRVTSLTAAYQAIEQFVLRRSTGLRFDFGVIVYRLFDDAYDCLSLVP